MNLIYSSDFFFSDVKQQKDHSGDIYVEIRGLWVLFGLLSYPSLPDMYHHQIIMQKAGNWC